MPPLADASNHSSWTSGSRLALDEHVHFHFPSLTRLNIFFLHYRIWNGVLLGWRHLSTSIDFAFLHEEGGFLKRGVGGINGISEQDSTTSEWLF